MVCTVRRVKDWLLLFSVCAIALATATGALAAQSQDETTPQQTNEKIQQLAALARTSNTDPPLGAGDLLHIDVFDVPELSRDVRVTDSGAVSFPLVPDPIPAAGLTTYQFERKLEGVLSADGLVAHPQVSVFVKEQASQPVTIVGAVGHPMVMQIVRPTSLLEVLAQAGGVADDAGAQIMITRAAPSATERVQEVSAKDVATTNGLPDDPPTDAQVIKISLKDLVDSGNADYNIQVRGGDIISVPRAGIIYVLGFGVAQQGEYVLQAHGDQVTALKAIALAHGMTSFAKGDDSVIMRNDPKTGKRIEIPVHLKKIQNHKAQDVPLLSNDILYVPDSKGKKALAVGTQAAIGIGTSIAIYHVAY
jgi:polysaccharide biosynthesis/export protein